MPAKPSNQSRSSTNRNTPAHPAAPIPAAVRRVAPTPRPAPAVGIPSAEEEIELEPMPADATAEQSAEHNADARATTQDAGVTSADAGAAGADETSDAEIELEPMAAAETPAAPAEDEIELEPISATDTPAPSLNEATNPEPSEPPLHAQATESLSARIEPEAAAADIDANVEEPLPQSIADRLEPEPIAASAPEAQSTRITSERRATPAASDTVKLFQQAHTRMALLHRLDVQLEALLEQRHKLQADLADIQSQINDEFTRISSDAESTLSQIFS